MGNDLFAQFFCGFIVFLGIVLQIGLENFQIEFLVVIKRPAQGIFTHTAIAEESEPSPYKRQENDKERTIEIKRFGLAHQITRAAPEHIKNVMADNDRNNAEIKINNGKKNSQTRDLDAPEPHRENKVPAVPISPEERNDQDCRNGIAQYPGQPAEREKAKSDLFKNTGLQAEGDRCQERKVRRRKLSEPGLFYPQSDGTLSPFKGQRLQADQNNADQVSEDNRSKDAPC